MQRLFTLFLLLTFPLQFQIIAQGMPTVVPEAVDMSSDRLEYLSETLRAYVKDNQLPGSVALVARRGKVAYWEAFGYRDVENSIPLQKKSIFRIASQTKAIVSVGIMMLQEEGKLLITDPVGKYIPEFQQTTVAVKKEGGGYEVVPAKRKIDIRDLLTHTSGIGYGYGVASDEWEKAGIQGWYFANREEPILETVKRMAALPFDAHPGEKYVYGYSTDILGAIVEVASGMTLEEFLQQRILTPLGMKDTHFYLPQEKADRLAVVYSATERGLKRAASDNPMQNQGAYVTGPKRSFSGGAGLLSTAEDYVKFLQMMLDGGTYNGRRILSRKSVELMTRDHLGEVIFPWTPGTGFGLGFSVVTDLGVRGFLGSEGEYGWGGAYHSTYWVDPKEELVVVYFTQIIPAGTVDDHQKLRALIYQALD
ncbi:serine hydrolase [Lewinella sp. W8]|uniref:serine hydrolase domain-containing protein n=1 Tax=Lewinella sp. W8 TaxID=2528208 RepID=UPI00106787C5|nr:serine hydrolase domain-containing protein [Lewinella sp. W8]MTB51972.1 serine hydrolase [Lewinella sp. W8]